MVNGIAIRVGRKKSPRKPKARKPPKTPRIVSDIGIPGEDGYSFMAKLRTSASHPPAIALTAYARAEDRDRIMASGFAFHLAKPVDPVVMALKVREAVR